GPGDARPLGLREDWPSGPAAHRGWWLAFRFAWYELTRHASPGETAFLVESAARVSANARPARPAPVADADRAVGGPCGDDRLHGCRQPGAHPAGARLGQPQPGRHRDDAVAVRIGGRGGVRPARLRFQRR